MVAVAHGEARFSQRAQLDVGSVSSWLKGLDRGDRTYPTADT
ncbi:hypothetical protein [Oculatella sp. LEGE 06141]